MPLDRLMRFAAATLVALAPAVSACKSVPSAEPAVVPAAPVSGDRKVGWILRLEQQRVLRDADVPAAAVTETTPPASRVQMAPATAADLTQLIRDPDATIRERAALAIGRVRMSGGVSPLIAALQDPSPLVRMSAAFALGLIGDKAALAPLQTALADPSPLVRVRAVDAIGLIGDASGAAAIVSAAASCTASLASIQPDDEEWPKTPEIELCRSALFALVRLHDYDALARVALDAQGKPVSRWWPIAFALQRIGDRRAEPALVSLASTPGVDTVGFALRGLAALKASSVVSIAVPLAAKADADVKVRVAAVRALAQVGDAGAVPVLMRLFNELDPASPLGLEVMAAIGTLHPPAAFDAVVDLLTHRSPAVRAAALSAAAQINPDGFLIVLAGLGRDADWTVRASLAHVLATLPADRAAAALGDLADDEDARVHAPALEALAAIKAPDLRERLTKSLSAADFVERATAARLIGDARVDGGASLLATAYTRGTSDSAYSARLAAIDALAKYGGDAAIATLRQALNDREWPVRVRAAELLRGLGQAAEPVRPAALRQDAASFESAALLHPAFSPHAFIETHRGVIEAQLDVVAAPVTTAAFIAQARSGLFNGLRMHRIVPAFVVQDGDPRGDGEGGPGYTLRDELSEVPYLRGTMGMALDGPETGGSQWFITLTPQPHLDAKYTVFGKVVNGWDVLDRLAPSDTIDRVRIWDGVALQ
jgi:cyclophilin family peptidyl-prolyl cis-trans isomerase/HEAT repeat protein